MSADRNYPTKLGTAFGGYADNGMDQVNGMSLRDWLAGQALAGLCANPGGPFQHSEMQGWALVNGTERHVALEAYDLADVMLSVREVGR